VLFELFHDGGTPKPKVVWTDRRLLARDTFQPDQDFKRTARNFPTHLPESGEIDEQEFLWEREIFV
jgi:hypothetical protein